MLRGPCLGASQQLLCPLNIFLITCLYFFGLSQLRVLHCIGVFTFYNKYAHTYNLVFRQLLCIPEIQSLSLDLRCAFYSSPSQYTQSLSLDLRSQLHSILSDTLCYIYSPIGYGSCQQHVLDAELSQVEWEQLLYLVRQHDVGPTSKTLLAHR